MIYPIKEIAIGVLALIVSVLGYFSFNNYVDSLVQERYDKKVQEYSTQILDKVKVIESNSTILVKAREEDVALTDARLTEILNASKKKNFVTITKEGKCSLTGEFLDTYNSIVTGGTKK